MRFKREQFQRGTGRSVKDTSLASLINDKAATDPEDELIRREVESELETILGTLNDREIEAPSPTAPEVRARALNIPLLSEPPTKVPGPLRLAGRPTARATCPS